MDEIIEKAYRHYEVYKALQDIDPVELRKLLLEGDWMRADISKAFDEYLDKKEEEKKKKKEPLFETCQFCGNPIVDGDCGSDCQIRYGGQ